MVGLGGVEPPTCGLGNRRSIHLSYSPTYLQFTTTPSHPAFALACLSRFTPPQ